MLQHVFEEVGWAESQQQTRPSQSSQNFQVGEFLKITTKHGRIAVFNDQYCVVCAQNLFHTREDEKIC